MTGIIFSDSSTQKMKSRLIAHCPYGLVYFCDGTVNRSEMKEKKMSKRDPCVYFKHGKCTHGACQVIDSEQ